MGIPTIDEKFKYLEEAMLLMQHEINILKDQIQNIKSVSATYHSEDSPSITNIDDYCDCAVSVRSVTTNQFPRCITCGKYIRP